MTTYTPLNFTMTFRDGILFVELRGAIDSPLCLDAALESSLRTEAAHIVVVLNGVEYINSTGFGGLIRFSDAMDEAKKSFYIVGLQTKVHIVFQALGAHSVLNVLPTLADAIAQIASDAKNKA